jgi:hypothetical protein
VKLQGLSLYLLLLGMTMVAIPAVSQYCNPPCTIYDNGPVNGQVNALTINFGYVVTDSFYNGNGLLITNTITFWVWLNPGDNLQTVELSVGSVPYGTDQFHGTVSASQFSCFTNDYGYEVCNVAVYLSPSYFDGSLWLSLQNAESSQGSPVYWDQNSGVGCKSAGCPSLALQKPVGLPTPAATPLVPSEAFTIMGDQLDSK